MRFGVLGPLTVRTSDGRGVPVPEAKVRVLTALLIEPGRVVPADRLVELLWGERPPAKPLPSLRSKASQLRRALEEAEPGGRDMVRHRTGGYLLAADPQEVDAGRFTALVERARAQAVPEGRERTLSEALSLWRGEAFADLGGEPSAESAAVVVPAAVRLAELRLSALEDLYQARLDLGRHPTVSGDLPDLADLVRRHPFRERLRAVQIRALYASGRQSDALQSYLDLRAELDRELGVEPGPELAELYQSILRHDRGLGVPATAPVRGNVPAPATTLIGRQEQADEVRALLSAERLVTLTGTGGVGKTRLALEVAAGITGDFADGVWLVELAPLREPAQIAEAVAAALSLRDDTGATPQSAEEHLLHALADREALIILDNAEHLVAELADFTDRLLRACPRLRLLVTSRESLRLPAEHVQVVPPLAAPDAARLFVERAAAAAPGFALSADNAEAVAALCRRLDGVPLALELAASQARGLGVHELAARLDDRFTTLTARYRGVPERHRTLRAVIDWSWDLLKAVEQRVLRRLAVHADGCALAAAEAVSAFAGVDRTEVLDALTRLVDRSLVTVAFHDGRPRYRLLESVNAYCRERLREAEEEDTAHERARAHYVTLAEQAEAGLRGRRQQEALARLDLEALNIRAVLGRALHTGDTATALRLAAATTWYLFLRGRYHEAHRTLTEARTVAEIGPVPDHLRATRARVGAWREALAMLAGTPTSAETTVDQAFTEVDDPVGRARAAWFVLHARADLGDHSAGPKSLDPVVDRLRTLDDTWGTAAALATRARYALVLGDLEAVRRDAEEATALFDRIGDQWGRLRATAGTAYLAEITGDYDRATALHRDGLGLAERLSLAPEVVGRLSGLGRIALLTGDYARADDLHRRAARLAADRFDRQGEAFAEFGLAISARRQGHLDEAERWWNRLLPWCRSAGDLPGVAFGTTELGFVAELRGDAETALDTHIQGIEAARETGDPRALALALEGTAGACALHGQAERAARLLGAATVLRASVGAPLPKTERADVDRISEHCRELLGERYPAELSRGEQTNPDSVVEEAARARITRRGPARALTNDRRAPSAGP